MGSLLSSQPERVARATELMTAFAARTGLEPAAAQRRYLWTDAFAVGNFLALARATGERRYTDQALRLVEAVHQVLGRHRGDDGRTGWISGRGDGEGAAHPTCAGLRIGKPLPERRADEPIDEELEWERDGQYFHYLTRWIHALCQAARATGTAAFVGWARELGQAAHHAFTWALPGQTRRRLYWKMSIDLSRPLVASMGQHDALDGYVACLEVEATAARFEEAGGPSLAAAARDLAAMIDPGQLTSADPLGIGGLLVDAQRLARLAAEGAASDGALVQPLLAAARAGLDFYVGGGQLRAPLSRRLAFREAGLAIGLQAAVLMRTGKAALGQHNGLVEEIVSSWLTGPGAVGRAHGAHVDIDEVMLATVLVGGEFVNL